MTDKTFKQGDTVYSEHGEQAEFIASTQGEFLVRPLYEDDDYGGTYAGEVTTWKLVFRSPPKPKLDAETAAAQKRLQELQEQVALTEQALRGWANEESSRIERIRLHDELADIDKFLSGQVTHYVSVQQYRPLVEIIAVEDTLENHGSYYDYALLKLYPSRNWNKKVRWSVTWRDKNRYNSDSRTADVFPCCGLEEAQAKAKEVTEAMVTEYLTNEKKRSNHNDLIANCNKYGVPVPKQITDDLNAMTRKHIQSQLDDYQKRVNEFTRQLAALPEVQA